MSTRKRTRFEESDGLFRSSTQHVRWTTTTTTTTPSSSPLSSTTSLRLAPLTTPFPKRNSSSSSSPSPRSTSSSALNIWPRYLFFDSVSSDDGSSGGSGRSDGGSDGSQRDPPPPPTTTSKQPQPQQSPTNLPLSSLVELGPQFHLAHTPEDKIDKLQVGQRLCCIGDVHGDVEALRKCLDIANVYDRTTECWTGGNTILVQCGDILDRGTQELACYTLLAKLSQQAPQYGGRVVLLTGNHEIMNAYGNFDYVTHDDEYEQSIAPTIDKTLQTSSLLSSLTKESSSNQSSPLLQMNNHSPQWRNQYGGNHPTRWSCFEPGGLLASQLMSNMKVAFQVGGTVCVHAGLQKHIVVENGGISGLNKAYREWIMMDQHPTSTTVVDENRDPTTSSSTATAAWSMLPPNPIKYNHVGDYASVEEQFKDAIVRERYYGLTLPSFLRGPDGPIWMRDYSSPSGLPPKNLHKTQQMLDDTLATLNANRMVMGHTIQRQINAAMEGKAWRVDVGMSYGCGSGTPEVLEIVGVSESGGEKVSVLTEDGAVPGCDRYVHDYVSLL